ncbi:hypothetical protein CEXT_592151 [Caerostris extrusa]|uniref:Uncharacterized protein n=1 Tax=Caerostris extrusa TaxID=172846 RepID=A0AAV4SVN2_CAEEX|nr:hypothetical protein CEXT_592151 [Caerostris extrusa]
MPFYPRQPRAAIGSICQAFLLKTRNKKIGRIQSNGEIAFDAWMRTMRNRQKDMSSLVGMLTKNFANRMSFCDIQLMGILE